MNFLDIPPYSLKKEEKEKFLLTELQKLTEFHSKNCDEYYKILKAFGYLYKKIDSLEKFFPLPVRLFKDYELKSCRDDEVVKVLTSSGTTSQKVSKIFLDKETSIFQTKALVKIMQNFLGKKRLPMLIIDTKAILKNRRMFSARGAGILGLSNFGKKHTYVLDEDMNLDIETLEKFLDEYKNEEILLFGFTFMVWKYFYKQLKEKNIKLDIEKGILFHSGGWKKLTQEAVDNDIFKKEIFNQTKIKKVHNFYGMVEQVGSIFVECEYGHLHTPVFADIIIRDPFTLKPLKFKQEGIVEVLSILPRSYPGHTLLTEDLGTIIGEDDCPCGRMGKYFTIKGRLPKAEIRGCSDTHAFDGEKK
jgi:phenylacetate-coenzyme A ligase PaaK-like adenylate-forming protein